MRFIGHLSIHHTFYTFYTSHVLYMCLLSVCIAVQQTYNTRMHKQSKQSKPQTIPPHRNVTETKHPSNTNTNTKFVLLIPYESSQPNLAYPTYRPTSYNPSVPLVSGYGTPYRHTRPSQGSIVKLHLPCCPSC